MTRRIGLQKADVAVAGGDDAGEIAPDLAYRRLLMVNVGLIGRPDCGDRGWVLVDTGLAGSAGFIRRAAAARFGKSARPVAIVLTHGHFDHVGTVEELASSWDVPVYAHPLEHPYLTGEAAYPPGDPAVGGGLMASMARLYPRGPIDLGGRLRPLPAGGDVPGLVDWRWLPTPGHSVGHVSLWRPADRVLVAGDAFCTTAQESAWAVALQKAEVHGPPAYFTVDWARACDSVRALAALEPEVALPGHGRPLRGPVMREALHRLAQGFETDAVPNRGRYIDHPARAEDGTAYAVAPRGSAPT